MQERKLGNRRRNGGLLDRGKCGVLREVKACNPVNQAQKWEMRVGNESEGMYRISVYDGEPQRRIDVEPGRGEGLYNWT